MAAVANETQKSTPSTGRECCVCHERQFRDSFSTKQWEAHAHSRRCKKCIEEGKTKPKEEAIVQPQTSNKTQSQNNTKTIELSKSSHEQQPQKKPRSSPIRKILSSPKSKTVSTRAKILDSKGEWFTNKAELVFKEIFDRFDVDKDDAWNVSEIQSFAEYTNGVKFTQEELKEIKNNLQHNKDGNLTRQGFLDFYHLQTQSHKDETWKDLHKLGYTNQLRRREDAIHKKE